MRIEDYTLNFRDQSVVEAISGAELIDKLLRQVLNIRGSQILIHVAMGELILGRFPRCPA